MASHNNHSSTLSNKGQMQHKNQPKQQEMDKTSNQNALYEATLSSSLTNSSDNQSSSSSATNSNSLSTINTFLTDDNNPNRPKRICVVGNVDAGKSTLVACLSKHILDDGRGGARSKVLRHRHELEGGKSSAVAQEIVGYDEADKQIIPSDQHSSHSQLLHSKIWAEVAEKSSFTLTLVDLCGHERYLKTTVFGLVGYSPDAAMLVVGSNAGFQKMAREHLQLMLALKIPFFIVFTKVDSMTPKNIALETLSAVEKVMRNVQKKPYRMRGEKQIDQAVLGLWSGKITPMFSVSCVTGDGLELLRTFLGRLSRHDNSGKIIQMNSQDASNNITLKESKEELKSSTETTNVPSASDASVSTELDSEELLADVDLMKSLPNQPKKEGLIEFVIDSNFLVPGVGVVAGGRMVAGTIKTGDRALLGPDKTGAFRPIIIRSIHVNCRLVEFASAGTPATFAIRSAPAAGREKSIAKSFPFSTINPIRDPLVREQVTKGMAIVAGEELTRNLVAREFEANVHCLHSSTTITCGYAPVVNIGAICKTARVIAIDGMVGRRSGPKKNKKLPPSVSASISSKLSHPSSATDQVSSKEANGSVASSDTTLASITNAASKIDLASAPKSDATLNAAEPTVPPTIEKEIEEDDESGPSLRTGMRARLRFQFDHPQRVSIGQVLVFREGRARGVGRVTAIFE